MTTSNVWAPDERHQLTGPASQAFVRSRIGFTVAPIVFGLDKFAHALVSLANGRRPLSSPDSLLNRDGSPQSW